MKITPKQLVQLIKEELSSVREIDKKSPWEGDHLQDVVDAYATDGIVFGHSIGFELQEVIDKIDRDDPEQRKAVYVGLMKAADKARKFVAQGFDGPSVLDEADEERVKLKSRGMTKSAQVKQLRGKAKGVQSGEIGGDFTNIERSLVQQISDVVTKIASAPEVDLGKYRSQINVILNKLKNMTNAEFESDKKA